MAAANSYPPLVKDAQSVSADIPGLASAMAKLLCTLLPVLQVRLTIQRRPHPTAG